MPTSYYVWRYLATVPRLRVRTRLILTEKSNPFIFNLFFFFYSPPHAAPHTEMLTASVCAMSFPYSPWKKEKLNIYNVMWSSLASYPPSNGIHIFFIDDKILDYFFFSQNYNLTRMPDLLVLLAALYKDRSIRTALISLQTRKSDLIN